MPVERASELLRELANRCSLDGDANSPGVSYGFIHIGHDKKRLVHQFVYLAQPTGVMFIDCQAIHKGKGKAVEQNLEALFDFEDSAKEDPAKFQRTIFVAPSYPHGADQKLRALIAHPTGIEPNQQGEKLATKNVTETPHTKQARPAADTQRSRSNQYGIQARALLMANQPGEALQAINKALELNPNFLEMHIFKGESLYKLNRLPEAVDAYDRALEIAPTFPNVQETRARTLEKMNRLPQALEAYNKAIELNPGNAHLYNRQGVVLFRLEQFPQALEAYNKAITLNPEDAVVHKNRGVVLIKLNQLPQALQAFNKSIALKPRADWAHQERGIVLIKLNRLSEALEAINIAIAISPNNPVTHEWLSHIHDALSKAARKRAEELQSGKSY